MAVVHLKLFGPPEAWVGGELVALPTRKLLILLAYLAIEGSSSREKLAALLWNDREYARSNLRGELYRLKRTPLFEALDDAGGRIGLRSFTTDLQSFEQASGSGQWESALHLRRGPLLEGLERDQTVEFEEWLWLVRERWEERYNQALTAWATALEAARNHAGALESYRRLSERDPLHEEAQRAVIRLYAQLGQPAKALEQYARFAALLENQLGTAPTVETQALVQTLRQTPSLIGIPHPTKPQSKGREREWSRLEAAQARGQFAFLVGNKDTGKTRLLLDYVSAKGYRMGLIEGQPGEASTPFLTLVGLTRRMLQFRPAFTLEPTVQAELARLLPELGPSTPLRTVEDRLRFFQGITRFLHTVMPENFAKVADNIHFFDPDSLELILYETEQAMRSGDRRPMLGAFRPEALPAPQQKLIEAHLEADLAVLIELN